MADSIVSITLEIARDLLIEEARFLWGVKDQVEEIKKELNRMKIYLEYVDAKKVEDRIILNRVTEIRELADEVEEVLETFAIKVASRRRREGKTNTIKRYVCIFKECVALHKVGSDIGSIKTKITNLTSSLPTYDRIHEGESSSSAQEKLRWKRLSYPHFEEDFVGMVDDISKLVSHLVKENKKLQVVSICGMGGLGKTTLAKKVYKHEEVRRRFNCFAWVCITQQWNPKDILQQILMGLVPHNKEEMTKMGDGELVKKIFEVQEKKKCLVVIDDIWSTDAWDILRPAFPSGETNSKVLLTTRIKEVALHADPSGFLHEPQCLGEEESWDLLQKKAFPARDIQTEFTIDPSMKKLGMEMLGHCKGLPLAVVVLGGMLVTKPTLKEWKVVLDNIKIYLARGEGMREGVSSVLILSYDDLPYQLKPCFLYLGNFKEDSEIKTERLYNLWVAERLVSSDDRREGETMMNVAERYLGELEQRCMVHVRVREVSTARKSFKSCRVHDLMRDLCVSKAREERFFEVIEEGSKSDGTEKSITLEHSSSFSKMRRLAIHSFEHYNINQTTWNLRSILFFFNTQYYLVFPHSKMKPNMTNFKLLRVLDLEGIKIHSKKFPPGIIGRLMQLRYLSLRRSYVPRLAISSIGNLENLQTLDLKTYCILIIPNVLWKLKSLRHLYLPSGDTIDRSRNEKKLRVDGLSNLMTLVKFNSKYFEIEGLLELSNLRKLTADIWWDEDMGHLATAITSLRKLPLLQESHLRLFGFSIGSEEKLLHLPTLLGYHHIYKLYLSGPIKKLPEGHFHFSPNLSKLELQLSELEEDPMPTLEKLPSLIVLGIWEDAFIGKEMVCSAMGFPQLTELTLHKLPNLKNLRVDKGAFPKLRRLSINNCFNLKMIPNEITQMIHAKTDFTLSTDIEGKFKRRK